MSSTWGRVLDQASIMLSRQDLEKACIKATRHDDMIPKEKHVRSLVVCTHERPDLTDKIVFHLTERLDIPDWIVVLKTLEVYHRLFRDGNARFLSDLKWKGPIFPLSKFNDPTTAESHTQSVFIRKYAQYLEEKLQVYRALRLEFEKDPSLLKGLTIDEAFIRLPKLQRQLDALIHCQTSAEAITNPITSLAFEMLLKDSFKLYRGLNDGVITLLEKYFTMDKMMAANALDIYKTFMRETSSIIAMYEMAKKKFTLELPDLKHAPTTLINSLEDYLRDLDEGGGGGGGHPPPQQRNLFEEDNINKSGDVHRPAAQNNSSSSHHTTGSPSLIDPFGVTESYAYQQPTTTSQLPHAHAHALSPHQQTTSAPTTNLFDPFGDSLTPTTNILSNQPAQANPYYSQQQPQQQQYFHQQVQQPQFQQPNHNNLLDPFAALQPQTQSAYGVPLSPTMSYATPASPTMSSPPPSTSYSRGPNYNTAMMGAQQPVYNTPQQQYTPTQGNIMMTQGPPLSPTLYATTNQQQPQQSSNPFL